MQKKVFGAIALCGMIAALSACGDSNSDPTGSSSTGAASSAANSSSSNAGNSSQSSSSAKASSIKLSSASYSVAAAAGKAVLTVERAGSSGSTTIQYTTSNGSGKDGVDYTGASGQLSWGDGDTSIKKIYVAIGSKGSGKTFKVSLKASTSAATIASPNVATVTITAPAEAIPAGAEQAGYRTQTFGSSLKMGDNWHNMSFFGWSGAGGVNNGDGTVSIAGSGSGTISTGTRDMSKPNQWRGVAFGGGAYFEAEFSFKNADEEDPGIRWPAFWAVDIENMAANAVTDLTQWSGQPEGFGNWIETDFMEYDLRKVDQYGVQIHNWYGFHERGKIKDVTAFKKSVHVPAGFKWSDKHTYGFLWVPATASSHGYAQAYLDDVPMGDPVYWTRYDPKAPPSPLMGTTAFSVIDSRHMALLLDTGAKNPMIIHSVSVWQKSAANNITE